MVELSTTYKNKVYPLPSHEKRRVPYSLEGDEIVTPFADDQPYNFDDQRSSRQTTRQYHLDLNRHPAKSNPRRKEKLCS